MGYPLQQSPFYRLPTRRKLAELLGLPPRELDDLARRADLYRSWDQPDSKGKIRHIDAPRQRLRRVHARVASLLSRIHAPDFLFCPVKRRSYVSNAAQHAGATEVRTLDVRAYFPSTPARRVYWFFHTVMQCPPDVAAVLARILTVDGRLATGSPVSPILSFCAFFDTWSDVARLVAEAGCVLTVYMDDVTVSGSAVPDRLMWEIRRRIHGSGLCYHKMRRFSSGYAEVTGIVLRGGQRMVPHRQHRKAHEARRALRAATSLEETERLERRLLGLEAQRRQVEAGR